MLSQAERRRRAQIILKRLDDLYPNPPIPLDHTDAFSMLIAVLLSAQCTDKRVNTVTPELFRLARTPETMARQKVEDVLKIVKPCGLGPQKAKAIVGLSKILVEKYAGQVPDELEELETLPGVGHKTAQVVIAQCFDKPAFPVDTHIHRLAKRWKISSGKSVIQTERDLKSLFAEEHWNKLHLQFIYYGREYCTARGCQEGADQKSCELCLLFNAPTKKAKFGGKKRRTAGP